MTTSWYSRYPGEGILQDKQEKLPWIAATIEAAGVQVTPASMSAGDYGWIANGVRYLVEAKWSASDFFGSLYSGRLKSQLQRCLVESDRAFLIVPDLTWPGVEATTATKLLGKIRCWGVQVIGPSMTKEGAVAMMLNLYWASLDTWPLEGQERAYKTIKEGSPTERALRSLRVGIGPLAAAKLVGRYRTLAGIAAVTRPTLVEVVGKAAGEKLWETLHCPVADKPSLERKIMVN